MFYFAILNLYSLTLLREQQDLTVILVIGIYHQLKTFHHSLKEQVRLVEEDCVIGESVANSRFKQQIQKICSKILDVNSKTLRNGKALGICQGHFAEVIVYQQLLLHQCHR